MSGDLPRRGNMNIQRELQNLEAKKRLVAPGDSLYIVLGHSRMEWHHMSQEFTEFFFNGLAVGRHTGTTNTS